MAEPQRTPSPLDAESFVALALEQDLDTELHGGEVGMMAPERAAHACAKAAERDTA